MKIEAVLFDMDGTLLDSERVWQDGLMSVAGDIDGVEAFAASVVGVHVEGVIDLLHAWLPAGHDPAQVLADWEAEAFGRLANGAPLKPGARLLIDTLRAREVPMAVVTSSGRDQAIKLLTVAGLYDDLDALVTRDDVAQPKPHPEPYLKGAQALNIDVGRCAAFEDSPTGVRSAVAAGAQVVHVPDGAADGIGFQNLRHTTAKNLLEGARSLGLL